MLLLLEKWDGWGGQKKGEFSKDPRGRPRNIHMLSDSCLRPFPLSTAREGSAGYKRRDPHPCYPPPSPSPLPHSQSVQQSPQQQQRRLITVKHLRLLFNSSHRNYGPSGNKGAGSKHTHKHKDKGAMGRKYSLCMGKQRKDPHGEMLSCPVSISHNICPGKAERQTFGVQIPLQQRCWHFLAFEMMAGVYLFK